MWVSWLVSLFVFVLRISLLADWLVVVPAVALACPLLRGAGGYGSLQPSQHVLVSWPRMTELAAAKMLATTWVIMPLFIPPIYHRRLTEPRLKHTKLIEVDVCNLFLQCVYYVVCVCVLAVKVSASLQSCLDCSIIEEPCSLANSCHALTRWIQWVNESFWFHWAWTQYGSSWLHRSNCTKVCDDVIVQRYWVPWSPMWSVDSTWRNRFNGFLAARIRIVSNLQSFKDEICRSFP